MHYYAYIIKVLSHYYALLRIISILRNTYYFTNITHYYAILRILRNITHYYRIIRLLRIITHYTHITILRIITYITHYYRIITTLLRIIPILHRFFSDRALKVPIIPSAPISNIAHFIGDAPIKRCNIDALLRIIRIMPYDITYYYALLRILRILCIITHYYALLHYAYYVLFRYCIVFLVTAHLKCPYPLSANFEYHALYRGCANKTMQHRCTITHYYALLRIITHYYDIITHITHYYVLFRYCIVFLVTAHLKCPLSPQRNFQYRALYRGCANKRCNIDALLRIITHITHYYVLLRIVHIITHYYVLFRYCIVFLVTAHLKCPLSPQRQFRISRTL
jgi:uncharacterized membrane protein YtjA (UPF0391 family)